MRLRPILTAALAAALLALTGCAGTENPPAATATTAVEPAPQLTADDLAEHTKQTFDVTWALASETDRDTYCNSVALLGPNAAADEMAQGAGYSDDLDWLLMARYLEAECNTR